LAAFTLPLGLLAALTGTLPPAPPLTPELRDAMVAGCEDEAAGRSIADLQRQRDAFLVELLQLLETHHADPPR
ncbi:MAG: hypothetical protein ACKOSO_05310, partial [Actinomycetota bacterium]